jgi:uncharacterized protein YndB with AHSA1/START domain
MTPHKIVKQTVLNSTVGRVWQAISNSAEFGSWFGMKVDGPFEAGKTVKAVIMPTTVDDEVAEGQKAYQGLEFELKIEKVESEKSFSFRWHPHAVDRSEDYSEEPTTLVEFTLAEVAEGVLLTVTESGFEGIPLERRAQAFNANSGGWAIQMELIAKYLAKVG